MLANETKDNQKLKISSKCERRCSSLGERRSFVMITYQSSVAILIVEWSQKKQNQVGKDESDRKKWIYGRLSLQRSCCDDDLRA